MQDCQYDGDCQNGKFWSEHRFLFLGWSLEVFFQGFSLRSPGIFSRVPSGLSWVFYPWLSFYGTLYKILSQGYPLQSPGVSLQGQRSLSTCFSSCLPLFLIINLEVWSLQLTQSSQRLQPYPKKWKRWWQKQISKYFNKRSKRKPK